MTDETKTKAKPTKRKTKSKRVAVVNAKGKIARPYEKDIDAWLGKNWKRVDETAGNAD